MKKLEDSILIYDAECPLCRVYSKGFTQIGMLEENGRMDYGQMDTKVLQLVDTDRARNEIALVNTHTQTVKYGIDSLFLIIGNSAPFLQKLFDLPLFYQLMKRVYAFISYNRRIIIGGALPHPIQSCHPDFNLKYRVAYLVFATFVSSVILKHFSLLLGNWWPIPKGWTAEILLVSGQMLFQSIALLLLVPRLGTEKWLDYLANLMTVALIGSLLLVPALLLPPLFPALSVYVYLGWFAVVVAFMFWEHKRRVKVNQLPSFMSYTWVGYRILVSSTCLYLNSLSLL